MKKIVLLCFMSATLNVLRAENEKEISSNIQSVNVFLNQAEIKGSASATVAVGITDVVITNLSQYVLPNTVQVTGMGDVTIMSVQHRMNYMNKNSQNKRDSKIKELEAKLETLTDEVEVLQYKINTYWDNLVMMNENRKLGGANTGVNFDSLEEAVDWYAPKRLELEDLLHQSKKSQKVKQTEQNEVANQLNQLRGERDQPTSEIVVKIHARTQQNVKLDVTYMVNNAGWYPIYDLRAEDGKNKVNINYKANIYQNTGVDWKDVQITLSTGNPSLGTTKPELSPWFLYLQELEQNYQKTAAYDMYGAPAMAREEIYADDKMGTVRSTSNQLVKSKSMSDFTVTNMKQLSTEYKINFNQTIPSDGKYHMVNVKDFAVTSEFKHAAVPKLDKDAFLMAHLIDWEQHDWISGEINVFYDGTYVGKTYLDISQVEDTLTLSLGRDKKVAITREKIKDYCSTKSLGMTRKKTFGYDITVRNNKKETLKINIQDQVPVSQNEKIEVKVVELSGGKQDNEKGFVDWELELKPGETKTIQIKFEVKYPKKYTIPNL